MIATGIGVVTNIILNLIFIPRYGLTAAAWTTLVTELVAATIMTVKFFVTVASLRQSYSRSKEI